MDLRYFVSEKHKNVYEMTPFKKVNRIPKATVWLYTYNFLS